MKEMYLPTVQVEKAVHQLYRTLQSFVNLKVLLTLAFSAGVWEAELQKKKGGEKSQSWSCDSNAVVLRQLSQAV